MKTCEETHELCSIMIQRFWPLRYGVLWNGGYSLPRTMRGGCRSVASFFFLGRSCAGGGGYAAILFLLLSSAAGDGLTNIMENPTFVPRAHYLRLLRRRRRYEPQYYSVLRLCSEFRESRSFLCLNIKKSIHG